MIRCEPRRSRAVPANFVQARQARVRNTIGRPTLPEVAALVAAARPKLQRGKPSLCRRGNLKFCPAPELRSIPSPAAPLRRKTWQVPRSLPFIVFRYRGEYWRGRCNSLYYPARRAGDGGLVMTLAINDIAPDFEAETTEGKIRFHEWIG